MLIVGGGIRNGEEAREVAKAGADIIVTGTVVEDTSNVHEKISELVQGIRYA
jgi:phosphoglycerol geranylgeranyltransferase